MRKARAKTSQLIPKSKIVSALRRLWMFSDGPKEALEAARVELATRPKRVGYRCEHCGLVEKRERVKVDHRDPVVPPSGWMGWDSYVARLYVEPSSLQILCEWCHEKKTQTEGEARQKARKAAKLNPRVGS